MRAQAPSATRALGAIAPGVCAALAAVAIAGLAFAGLMREATGFSLAALNEPYLRRALAFTLLQATISTFVSVLLGGLLALALARRRFALRGLALRLLGTMFVLPSIVAVLGIVAVHGSAGGIASALAWLGLPRPSYLYGLPGIVLAHAFFNAPFAARAFLNSLEAVPGEHWRLAEGLNFSAAAIFLRIDLPILRRDAPAVAGLIFMLCAASFAIVLALGGGPQSATLEVAIYEALRSDFDLGRAALLALVQASLGLAMLAMIGRFALQPAEAAVTGASRLRPDRGNRALLALDALTFTVAFALIALPLLGALGAAMRPELFEVLRDAAFARALGGSLAIALPASLVATAMALALSSAIVALDRDWRRPGAARALNLAGGLILAVPPFATGTGLFIMLRQVGDPASIALPLVAIVNALMILPIACRLLEPALMQIAKRNGRLCVALGIAGRDRWRLVILPLLRKPLALAFATAFAISLGDLGVAALFGGGGAPTLPVLLYAYLGSYQIDRAAAVALLLTLLIAGVFAIAEGVARRQRDV